MIESLALDVDRIRREARQTMSAGPVTGSYGLDAERVISVLNDVVTTEVVGWLRSTRQSLSARGERRADLRERLDLHADQAMRHATAVSERIAQLGGHPNFDPATLAQRAHTDYSVPDDAALRLMLEQNLLASRIVMSTYQEIARWLGDRDATTRRLIESLRADEEAHAYALSALVAR